MQGSQEHCFPYTMLPPAKELKGRRGTPLSAATIWRRNKMTEQLTENLKVIIHAGRYTWNKREQEEKFFLRLR